MPRFDVFMEMTVEHRTVLRSKVRGAGDNPGEAAGDVMNTLGVIEPLKSMVETLGRRAARLIFYGERVVVYLVPMLDEKHQCAACGHPDDQPNPVCWEDCANFRATLAEAEQYALNFTLERKAA